MPAFPLANPDAPVRCRPGPARRGSLGAHVAAVNAFTAVNPETQATVCVVDYQVIGTPEQFRVYSDDEDDVARWNRVENG